MAMFDWVKKVSRREREAGGRGRSAERSTVPPWAGLLEDR
jgi:hypothetical protein